MVAISMTKIYQIALVLALGADAVQVANDIIMRREAAKHEVSLSSTGEFTSKSLILNNDPCDDDFPLGIEKSNDCENTTTDRQLDRDECLRAMSQAGGHQQNNNSAEFDILDNYYHEFPKGCYIRKRGTALCGPSGVCYYFNECSGPQCGTHTHNGTTIIDGQPVCYRPKIQYGTQNTNGGCPVGYSTIKDEDDCQRLSVCLTHCTGNGNQFRVNIVNASEYHEHPKYCFVSPVDNCAYFNEPLDEHADATGTIPDPSNPVGTPICNVSHITYFPSR